ncbi:hypothetical protein ACIA8C_20355 [Nocardia sp. NPDC051321]|uniref:hypothetical protein n=1 Tax=Nocardia sp. NPDC051321 TaxID=3364323 RepID=UPI0037ADE6EF
MNGVARYRPIRDVWGRVLAPLTALAAGLAAPWLSALYSSSVVDDIERPRTPLVVTPPAPPG